MEIGRMGVDWRRCAGCACQRATGAECGLYLRKERRKHRCRMISWSRSWRNVQRASQGECGGRLSTGVAARLWASEGSGLWSMLESRENIGRKRDADDLPLAVPRRRSPPGLLSSPPDVAQPTDLDVATLPAEPWPAETARRTHIPIQIEIPRSR